MTIAIIGSGIVGASIAYHLTLAGEAVSLYNNSPPAASATAWTFACLNAYGHLDRGMVETRMAAIAYQSELAKRIGADRLLHQNGTLRIAVNDQDADAMIAMEEIARDVGVEIRVLTENELRGLEPSLPSLFRPKRAIHVPSEGWSDALKMRNVLLSQAHSTGLSTWHERYVSSISILDNGVSVVSPDGAQVFSRAIVCAGVGTNNLVRSAGIAHDVIRFHPGLLCILSPTLGRLNHVLYFNKFHLRPHDEGTMVGMHEKITENRLFVDEDLRRTCVDELLDRTLLVFADASLSDVIDAQISIRPIPTDDQPICGFVDPEKRLGVAVMHGGVTLAPYLAHMLVDQLVNSDVASHPPKFSPLRTSLVEMSK